MQPKATTQAESESVPMPPSGTTAHRGARPEGDADDMNTATAAEQLFDGARAIAYLGLNRGPSRPRESLRWLRRTGRLRFTRIGRRIRYRREWLDELIDANSVLSPGR